MEQVAKFAVRNATRMLCKRQFKCESAFFAAAVKIESQETLSGSFMMNLCSGQKWKTLKSNFMVFFLLLNLDSRSTLARRKINDNWKWFTPKHEMETIHHVSLKNSIGGNLFSHPCDVDCKILSPSPAIAFQFHPQIWRNKLTIPNFLQFFSVLKDFQF